MNLLQKVRGSGSSAPFSFRKLTNQVHRWLGLASGLIVFIVAVTGCLYVFEKEIKALAYRDRLQVTHNGAMPQSVTSLWGKAQAALGETYPINRVEIPDARDRSYVFTSYKDNPDALTYFGEQQHYYRVFMNPYSGEVLKVENTKYEFFNLVVWLHWSLWLSNTIGQPIVGSAVLVFVVMLCTGLALWWPRNRAAFKTRLRVAWQAKKKRLNWDLHAVLGFYALIPALIIALTGLVWAFDWFSDAVYFVASGGESHKQDVNVVSDTTQARTPLLVDRIYQDFSKAYPGFNTLYLSIPENESGTISAYAVFSDSRHYPYVWQRFDRYSGKVLHTETFEQLNRGEKLRSMNYDLHVGSILGMPGKILAFFASLICSLLPVTGFLIWRGKRRAKRTTVMTSKKETLSVASIA
jgi:uncharacterized iron-regulated membrane protein